MESKLKEEKEDAIRRLKKKRASVHKTASTAVNRKTPLCSFQQHTMKYEEGKQRGKTSCSWSKECYQGPQGDKRHEEEKDRKEPA